MKRDRRLLATLAVAVMLALVVLMVFVAAGGALVLATLPGEDREALLRLLGPSAPLWLMSLAAALGVAAAMAQRIHRRWIAPPGRLLEQARVLLATGVSRELVQTDAGADVQGLARTLNQLVAQRDQLRRAMADEVDLASRNVEQERTRLAALMNELTQSVVVCNLDGRILLYNNRARAQFRALSDGPALARGSDLLGLGRSIYAVFDRRLVAHALESVQQRLQRGASSPSAQFVTTTRAGQLLRAQLAPVRGVQGPSASAQPAGVPVTGFVLMLENITRDYERQSAQERLLHGLTEGSRASLANLQTALEMMEDPMLAPGLRERFMAVVREEAAAMSLRVQDLWAHSAEGLASRWPLEDMMGADFVQAAQRRIELATQLRTSSEAVDAGLWLKVDSFWLLQALVHLALRLRDEVGVGMVGLRLSAAGGQRARLDLVWSGQAVSAQAVAAWETDAISTGQETSPLTVRDVVQRHGGEFWLERDRVGHQAFFRFLLSMAPATAAQETMEAAFAHSASRPEYYDFDLFSKREGANALDDRRLVDLTYTVFDTETTGLDPTRGDEIIQIGATRLVNGRVLRSESFDHLVDPLRSIPAAGIPIHGITPDMVAGKPTLAEVLPAFHRYAQDTVLVGHNAAFDMRFLQMKEASTGLRFDQPVLDTLLLSAAVHPQQESHRLEAIAERFNVTVIGRHTALGDALVTAEVFQKLIALLADMGIHTLGQARALSQETYYARLKY